MDSNASAGGNQTESRLVVAASPHIRDDISVAKIMWTVILCLFPALIFSIINFGLPALITVAVCVASSVLTEFLIQRWQKKTVTIGDGSAVLTGLLLSMTLPPSIPWYMPLLGSAVAIGIAKHTMGGLGYNIFNPAHIGRAFLLLSYPIAMTTWSVSHLGGNVDVYGAISSFSGLDAVTGATPLHILKMEGYDSLVHSFGSKADMYRTMLIGNRSGSLGETSALLLVCGGIILAVKGYIKWQVPVVMIGTVGLLTWIFGGKALFEGDPFFHMLAGGLVIGAFFMATDMVTIPMSTLGQIIFAFGAGAITVLIRLKGGYPEGVCYAILLMNALTPLIDRWLVPKKFGSIPVIKKRR